MIADPEQAHHGQSCRTKDNDPRNECRKVDENPRLTVFLLMTLKEHQGCVPAFKYNQTTAESNKKADGTIKQPATEAENKDSQT